MTRITVVIEDHADGIHLGQKLAGGRVVAAMQGDHSEMHDAAVKAAEYLETTRRDFLHAERYEEQRFRRGSDLYLKLVEAIHRAT